MRLALLAALAFFTLPARAEILNDVTQLNPVRVERVFRPRDAAEISRTATRRRT